MTQSSRIVGLLAVVLLGLAGSASALTFDYTGSFTLCTATCDSFASLGGPAGGSSNTTPSDVTGSVTIDVAAGGSFTESDITGFSFQVFNSNAPTESAMFDSAGNFLNPTSANPLPLDASVAAAGGFGTVDALGDIDKGSLIFTFTGPPFSNNGAQIFFDLATGTGQGFLFGGVVQFLEFDGQFETRPVPLPAAIWLFSAALLTGFGTLRRR